MRERDKFASTGANSANALSSRAGGASAISTVMMEGLSDMNELSESDPLQEEPANLKFLRRLVTVLTAVMILGLVVLISLVVIRLQTPALVLPETLVLPDGETAHSYTQGRGWVAVVTQSDLILIYDADTGNLRQTIAIE